MQEGQDCQLAMPWSQRLTSSMMALMLPNPAAGSGRAIDPKEAGAGGGWALVSVVAMEQVLQAARRVGVPWEAWEAAAALLR